MPDSKEVTAALEKEFLRRIDQAIKILEERKKNHVFQPPEHLQAYFDSTVGQVAAALAPGDHLVEDPDQPVWNYLDTYHPQATD